MSAHRRRAFSLLQIVATLPLLLLMAGLGYQLITRTMHVQGRLHAQAQEEAHLRGLIRQLKHDASSVPGAEIEADGLRLVLDGPEGEIVYASAGTSVTRTVETANRPPTLSWDLPRSRVRFSVESPGPRADLIWITFDLALPKASGPDRPERLSAAATVGAGGER